MLVNGKSEPECGTIGGRSGYRQKKLRIQLNIKCYGNGILKYLILIRRIADFPHQIICDSTNTAGNTACGLSAQNSDKNTSHMV